jgi:hypothetical protein
MERNAKLPKTWRTGDGSANAGKELFQLVGPHAAMILYGRKWWVVRFTEGDKDKFHRNHAGQLVATKPWCRALEIIGAGATPDECLWQLRGGTCRAMVGHGFRPVLDANGDWGAFVDGQGKPVQGGLLLS